MPSTQRSALPAARHLSLVGAPGVASPRPQGRGLPGAVALVVSLGFVMFLAMAATAAVAAPR